MLSLRSRKLALTLFCTLALALALVGPAQAADPLALNRRDHANLNRMIKKRTPDSLLDALNPVNNAGTGSSDDTAATSGSESAAAASSTAPASDTAASAAATSPTSSAAASSDTSSSTTPASTDSSTSTTASSTTSSSASSTSSTASSTTTSSTASSSSSTSAASTSSAAPATSAAAAPTSAAAVAAQDNSAEAVTITSHVSVSASPTSSATAKAATSSSSSLSKGAITTLAVIAGCIGGGALIWTIFRKWKLRTSKRFDDRLAPIDWQPPTDGDDVPGSNRRASIASSFHSAGHDGLVRAPSSSSSHGAYGAYGATGQHAPSLQPLPEHDFTAGPTTGYLGPNAGYADLARGPSPGPQMQDLSRGPSFNQGYNAYPQQQHAPAGAYDYNNAHY